MRGGTVLATVCGCASFRALTGSAMALPWVLAARPTLAHEPRGDGLLWQGGGILLVELGRNIEPHALGLSLASGAVALASTLGWAALLSLLVLALSGHRAIVARACARLGPLALAEGVTLLLRGVAVGMVVLLALPALALLDLEPPARELALGAFASLALGLSALVALWQDATRVELALGDAATFASLFRAGRLLWHRRVLFAAGWRAAAGLFVLGAITHVALDARGALGPSWLALFAGAFAWVVARASWLAWLISHQRSAVSCQRQRLSADS